MMVYFENPDDETQIISWNGKNTFHVGYFVASDADFDASGSFVPSEAWTQAGEYYLGREVPMNADKAMKIAKERFEKIEADLAQWIKEDHLETMNTNKEEE